MTRRWRVGLVALALGCASGEPRVPGLFRAGTAKIKITPSELGWLLCYDRHQKAEAVEADLWVRALALEDAGGGRGVLVSAEILGFPPSLARSIREEARRRFGLADGRLLLSATHTHNGPVMPDRPSLEIYHGFTEEETRPVHAYANVFRARVLEAIDRALSGLRPARLSWARGRATFGANRRQKINPNGPNDPDVPVLSVAGAEGNAVATIFTYACHCTTVMADTFFRYHSDYAGAAAEDLERARPGLTALFVAGCGGDINPDPRGKVELIREHGAALAAAVEETRSRLRPVAGPLKVSWREIDLPLEKAPGRDLLGPLLQYKIAARVSPEVEKSLPIPERRELSVHAAQRRHAREMLRRMERGPLPTSVPFPILIWRFGSDLTLVALSGETCVDYALRLKRELGPERTWVAGYANEVACYIPSDRVLSEGGYEAGWLPDPGRAVAGGSIMWYGWPAPLAPGLEDRIITGVHRMLAD